MAERTTKVNSPKKESGDLERKGKERKERLSPPWYATGNRESDLSKISKSQGVRSNQQSFEMGKQASPQQRLDQGRPKLRYLLPKPQASSPTAKVKKDFFDWPRTKISKCETGPIQQESLPDISPRTPSPEVSKQVPSSDVTQVVPSPMILPKKKALSIFLVPKTAPKPECTEESANPHPILSPAQARAKVTRASKRKTTEDPVMTAALSAEGGNEKCTKCDSAFKDKTMLETHTKDYHKVDSYACKNCKKGFICDGWTYQDHIKKCLLGQVETFNCPVCQKRFISRENCAIHQREQKHQTPGDVESNSVESRVERSPMHVGGEELEKKKRRTNSEVKILASSSDEEDPDNPDEIVNGSPAITSQEPEEERDAMDLEEDAVEYHCAYCDHKDEEQADLMEHVVNDHPDKDLKFKTRIPDGQGFSIFAWR